MKRIIALCLAAVFSLGSVSVFGSDGQASAESTETETEISAEDILEEYNIVNGVMRYDCLAGIMKAAGLQAETFVSDCELSFSGSRFYDTDYYSYPYAEIAYSRNITEGEKLPEESGYKSPFFYPQRIASVKECIAFMLPVLGYSNEPLDYDSAYDTAKSTGFITEADSFYSNGDQILTYEIYEILIDRMLNSKRYMYFTELNSDTFWDNYVFFDESGEMTYLEYLASVCPEDFSESENMEDELIKYNNIISVPYLNCLTAVTKIAGMRVEGLFDDYDILLSVAEASCLEGDELETVKDPKRYFAGEVQYGKENILFARTYGIIDISRDTKLYNHENAHVSVCVNYIMHILADIPEDMSEDEIYDLAKEKGIVKPEDSFYDKPEERLDYKDYKTLLTRMLNSGRYIYFTEEDSDDWFNAMCYDGNGEMTYCEYLNLLKASREEKNRR